MGVELAIIDATWGDKRTSSRKLTVCEPETMAAMALEKFDDLPMRIVIFQSKLFVYQRVSVEGDFVFLIVFVLHICACCIYIYKCIYIYNTIFYGVSILFEFNWKHAEQNKA